MTSDDEYRALARIAAAQRLEIDKLRGEISSQSDRSAYGAQRASRLPPAEREDLRERMTGEGGQRTIGWDPNHPNDLVFPQITKEEARRRIEARAREGRDGPPRNPQRGRR